MALKHGSTTITILKHGSTTINTGKHGSTTVFTVSTGQSWHTVMSDSFYPNDNESQQEVCDIPSGATEIRITLQCWLYSFDTEESTTDIQDTREFDSTNQDVTSLSYGDWYGWSEYTFYVSNGILYVDNTMQEGSYGVAYVEITKVEAYY